MEVFSTVLYCCWGVFLEIMVFQIPVTWHLLGTYWFSLFQRRPSSTAHEKSMINHITFFSYVRTTYYMQLSLLYSNFLFTDRTECLLMVFKCHVLSKSWLKNNLSKMILGHPMSFPNTTTDHGYWCENWNSLLYC